MEIAVRREDEKHERTLVYGVSGVGKVEHPDFRTIEGGTVMIELERDEDRSPWRVYMVALSGPRILVSGNVGVRDESHSYTDQSIVSDPHAPTWLTALVDKALRKAEADRLGVTPPCPKCGTPAILADPLRPEEDGEYCEPCAFHFDAGNGLRRLHVVR